MQEESNNAYLSNISGAKHEKTVTGLNESRFEEAEAMHAVQVTTINKGRQPKEFIRKSSKTGIVKQKLPMKMQVINDMVQIKKKRPKLTFQGQ